ncbi:hypothetical protein [Meiothermus granaticius]|uniref:Cytochrome oxidase Caa3-type subunit IV domain-containing protein n=1 Tax=Meiothermus granaticius NBRC 107808 TaxID=1227551 RepID=A0A399FAL7_9DEIN|nr:hypothetical protein [Meiothermus granaticius]RIH92309.1 hypothetical protein Mgrana_01740 [Meiothermus granaticius NBRC 107808]GEM88047.1 hypothetical protein MGR01S_26720 [Meiothermus granaticius NBRC 107808]
MLGWTLAILFTIGVVLVTTLLYLALRPRSVEYEGEGADLRFIGFALLLIILTAATILVMLLLGRVGQATFHF